MHDRLKELKRRFKSLPLKNLSVTLASGAAAAASFGGVYYGMAEQENTKRIDKFLPGAVAQAQKDVKKEVGVYADPVAVEMAQKTIIDFQSLQGLNISPCLAENTRKFYPELDTACNTYDVGQRSLRRYQQLKDERGITKMEEDRTDKDIAEGIAVGSFLGMAASSVVFVFSLASFTENYGRKYRRSAIGSSYSRRYS